MPVGGIGSRGLLNNLWSLIVASSSLQGYRFKISFVMITAALTAKVSAMYVVTVMAVGTALAGFDLLFDWSTMTRATDDLSMDAFQLEF